MPWSKEAHAPQLLSLHSRARAPQLLSLRSRAHEPQLLKPVCLEPVLRKERSTRTTTKSSPRSLQLEKACTQQRRSKAAKNKLIK